MWILYLIILLSSAYQVKKNKKKEKKEWVGWSAKLFIIIFWLERKKSTLNSDVRR